MMAAQAGACAMVPIHREHQPYTPVERHGLPVASARRCWPLRTQSADLTSRKMSPIAVIVKE